MNIKTNRSKEQFKFKFKGKSVCMSLHQKEEKGKHIKM